MTTHATITLRRMHSVNGTTLGYFVVFDRLFFTAEDTEKLLPAGEYDCQIGHGMKSNRSAGLDIAYRVIENIPDRDSFVFFHVGNSHKEVNGCQAGGLRANASAGTVENSITAVKMFYKIMADNIQLKPIRLVVVDPV